MMRHFNLCCVLTTGLVLLAGSVVRADSRNFGKPATTIAKPVSQQTTAPVQPVSLSTSGDCCQTAPAPECKTYTPCVSYCGCCCCCGEKVSQTLKVKSCCDCCCCCVAEIPVCLPACCKDPKICCRCGLFGRTIVTYSYDCCCVTIVFRRCGDVVVKYS